MVNLMNFDAETVTLFRNTGWLDRVGAVTLTANDNTLLCESSVTLTATVTNLEDAVLPNVVVRFVHESTTVGYAVTNSNGIARFYHVIHTQGTHTFHAIVGEIGASTKVYVSEKDNVLSYEVMSGGDYGVPIERDSGNPSNPYDFARGSGIGVGTSYDWAVTGDKSIKIRKSGTAGTWIRFIIPNSGYTENKVTTVSIKLYCTSKGSGKKPTIGITQMDADSYSITGGQAYVYGADGEVEVSATILPDCVTAALIVQMNLCELEDFAYIDDVFASVEVADV